MITCALLCLALIRGELVAQSEAKTTTLEARGDDPGPELTPLVDAPAETPPAPPARGSLLLGVRAGAAVPLSFLRPGYLAGLEVHYRLPVLDRRLRLSAFGGRMESSGRAERIIPGRGHDPAFLQNVVAYPIEALLHFELVSTDALALTLGAGYALSLVRSSFAALGSQTTASSLGHSAVAQLGLRHLLGPGEAGVCVEGGFGAARLGELGNVGTSSLSSVTFSLTYALAVLP